MKVKNSLFVLATVLLTAAFSFAQTNAKKPLQPADLNKAGTVKSSPAYAEVLLQKTELLSEVESLLVEYTEGYPKVKEMRYETELLQKEMDKLLAVNPAEASKLTTALGKLMVRKCELATTLWSLQLQFNDQHPDVKRAKRKLEIFEAAINDIMQNK